MEPLPQHSPPTTVPPEQQGGGRAPGLVAATGGDGRAQALTVAEALAAIRAHFGLPALAKPKQTVQHAREQLGLQSQDLPLRPQLHAVCECLNIQTNWVEVAEPRAESGMDLAPEPEATVGTGPGPEPEPPALELGLEQEPCDVWLYASNARLKFPINLPEDQKVKARLTITAEHLLLSSASSQSLESMQKLLYDSRVRP